MEELTRATRIMCERNALQLAISQHDLDKDINNERLIDTVRLLTRKQARLDTELANLILAEKKVG